MLAYRDGAELVARYAVRRARRGARRRRARPGAGADRGTHPAALRLRSRDRRADPPPGRQRRRHRGRPRTESTSRPAGIVLDGIRLRSAIGQESRSSRAGIPSVAVMTTTTKTEGFSQAERDAMKARAAELRAEGKKREEADDLRNRRARDRWDRVRSRVTTVPSRELVRDAGVRRDCKATFFSRPRSSAPLSNLGSRRRPPDDGTVTDRVRDHHATDADARGSRR